jgi:hypothetical protein
LILLSVPVAVIVIAPPWATPPVSRALPPPANTLAVTDPAICPPDVAVTLADPPVALPPAVRPPPPIEAACRLRLVVLIWPAPLAATTIWLPVVLPPAP